MTIELKKQDKPIDPKLLETMNGLKAITAVFNLLESGWWPKSQWNQVVACQNYITSIHTQLLDQAKSHEEAYRIPELKDVVDAAQSEAS